MVLILLAAVVFSQEPPQQLCGTVVQFACNGRQPRLMTLLVAPGVSADVFAPSLLDAARIKSEVSLSLEQRVCVSGVLAQKQNATSSARFIVRTASDIVSQAGDPDDWPTADVYTDCDRGVQAVTVKTFPRPQYTQDAMKAQIQGAAMVQAIVGDTGQVERVRLVKSLDAEHGLDEAALVAAKQWTFAPAIKDGAPVKMQVMLELTFTLRK